MTTQCESEGCTDEARWYPHIVCRTSSGQTLFKGDTETVICDGHKQDVTIDHFMNDIQYQELCKTFDTLKREHPPRNLIVLEFREI